MRLTYGNNLLKKFSILVWLYEDERSDKKDNNKQY